MSDIAIADEKKDEKKKAEEPKELKVGDLTYNERVTVKRWETNQKEFLNPIPNVWAVRREGKDKDGKPVLIFSVRANADNIIPTNGTIITDAAGNEYEVTETASPRNCLVKLTKAAKAEPKKP